MSRQLAVSLFAVLVEEEISNDIMTMAIFHKDELVVKSKGQNVYTSHVKQ